MKILIFGLPGSGKTTLSHKLTTINNNINHYEADKVREAFDDWDFTIEGRQRQSDRMNSLAYLSKLNNKHCILDFICPLEKNRTGYDLKIFMDTIDKSIYEDTNTLFERPIEYDYIIKNYNYENIVKEILNGL
jgi:adenylylsulfate kinase